MHCKQIKFRFRWVDVSGRKELWLSERSRWHVVPGMVSMPIGPYKHTSLTGFTNPNREIVQKKYRKIGKRSDLNLFIYFGSEKINKFHWNNRVFILHDNHIIAIFVLTKKKENIIAIFVCYFHWLFITMHLWTNLLWISSHFYFT